MRVISSRRWLATFVALVLTSISGSIALAERLPIKVYTSADGLGSSASFGLVRDPRGFIWICSRDGLVRFDGYRFTTYRIGDETADPAVFDMVATRFGDYWINLNRGIDYRLSVPPDERELEPLSQGSDARVPFQAEPVTEGAFPRFEDDAGNLWTSDDNGIYLVTKGEDGYRSQLTPVVLPGNPTGKLTLVEFADARNGGGFWIGTNWGVIRRLPDGRMFHTSVKPVGERDAVQYFAEDNDERLWIAQAGGILVLKTPRASSIASDAIAHVRPGKLRPDGTAALPETPHDAFEFAFDDLLRGFSQDERNATEFSQPSAFHVFSSGDGKIWISTNQGLITYDGKRFRHLTTDNGLATNEPVAITEGLDGSIWIVSYGGLQRLNPAGLITFDESDGMERARIHNISEDAEGRLVTVSGNFNIGSFDGSKFVMARPKIPPDEIYMWQSTAGFLDSRGNWWLHTNKNLYRFSNIRSVSELDRREPDAVFNETNGLIGGNVARIFEDSRGDLWFSSYLSTEQRGLSKLDHQTGRFQNFFTRDGLPEVAVPTGFAEDREGGLWIGFVEGGLVHYRNAKFSAVEHESAPKVGVTHMFRDSKGRIWIATSREGLIRIEDPTNPNPEFKRITTSDGLTSNNVRCITEDNHGNIYVGTVRGVNRITPDTGRIVYYGTADGLAADLVSSIFRDRHGDIWIGTFNGLSRLKPGQERAVEPPQILISGLRIAGVDFSVSPLGQNEVYVPHQEPEKGNIQVDFLSTGSSLSSPTRYQHRFDGVGDWSAPSAESSVTFANLGAGSYRLLVRAVNPDGIASTTPAAVNFTILRPVWQRWWFLLLAAIVIASMIYLVYRYRIAQMLRLERVRTRIASDLHDDIGSSLSQIAILSEVAKQKSSYNGAAEPLRVIADTSREMVDSMSDIVWAINPQKDTLGDLVQRMRRFAEDTLDAKDIEYRFEFDERQSNLQLGAELRRETYLIFKEAVNNLAKHSEASEASIAIKREGNNLLIAVRDDGKGIDTKVTVDGSEFSFGGNGLPNMRRRAAALGGIFDLTSERGAGTVVSVRVPI